jgi:hypothetical protein
MGPQLPKRHQGSSTGCKSPYVAGGRKKKKTIVNLAKNARDKARKRRERQEEERRKKDQDAGKQDAGKQDAEKRRCGEEAGMEIERMEIDGSTQDDALSTDENCVVHEQEASAVEDGGFGQSDIDGGGAMDVDMERDGVNVQQPGGVAKVRRHRPRTLVPSDESIAQAEAWRALIEDLVPSYLAYQESVYGRQTSGFHAGTLLATRCQCRRRTQHKIICLFFECVSFWVYPAI